MGRVIVVGALAGIVVVLAGSLLFRTSARADTPQEIMIAIPTNENIVVGAHYVQFIGRPTSTSPVTCAPGTPQRQTVVIVDPRGGNGAEVSGVLTYHEHEVPLGSRYLITGGPIPCNAELRLYVATHVQ